MQLRNPIRMKSLFITNALLISLFFSFNASSQQVFETPRGWQFGLNFGYYNPSKYTANYFNGSDKNVNNAKFVMSNFYWYQEIFQKLIANDTILVSGLPSNMRYKISLMPGLYGQLTLNNQYAVCFEFNYMRLKTQDAITFEVDPKPYGTLPDLRMFTIRGVEERVYIDLGIKRSFRVSGRTELFAIGGLNLNNTKVLKSSFFVKGPNDLQEKEYSMINNYINGQYVPNSNSQTVNIYQGGIGFGMYVNGGATFHFGDILLEPGINAHWLNINLEGYRKFKPGAGVYIRFLFNNLLGGD